MSNTIDPILLARLDSIPLKPQTAEHLRLVLQTMEDLGGRWPTMTQPTYGNARDLHTAIGNLATAIHNLLSAAIENDPDFKALNVR